MFISVSWLRPPSSVLCWAQLVGTCLSLSSAAAWILKLFISLLCHWDSRKLLFHALLVCLCLLTIFDSSCCSFTDSSFLSENLPIALLCADLLTLLLVAADYTNVFHSQQIFTLNADKEKPNQRLWAEVVLFWSTFRTTTFSVYSKEHKLLSGSVNFRLQTKLC